MSRGVFLCTVAVRLATLTESGRERAATEIADLRQTGLELLAFLEKEPVRKWSSGASCLTTLYTVRERKPHHTLSNSTLNSGVVHPRPTKPLTFAAR